MPTEALAADTSAAVSITKTDIHADSVFNTEGYGSLRLGDTSWQAQTAPQYALINADGAYVFPFGNFPCEYNLYNGLFVNGIVTESDEYGSDGVYSLFDLNGQQIIPQTYDYLEFYNGYGVGITKNSDGTVARELIDASGNVILTLPDGFNLVESEGGADFMFEQRIWGETYFGDIGDYGDGLLWVYTGSGIQTNISEAQGLTRESQVFTDNAGTGGPYGGYLDLEGNVVIPLQYYSVKPFCEGLAAVQEYTADLNGKWKYITTAGETAFPGSYLSASDFNNGYAIVSDDTGQYGYIDTNGTTVLPLEYDGAFGGENGLFTVGKQVNGQMRYGIVDGQGREVLPPEYDDLSNLENGVAYGIQDGVVYVIRTNGSGSTAFPDVPSNEYYADAVNWAVEQGITNGTSKTTFSPDDPCTRAQIVTFLWNAAGKPAPTAGNVFADVRSDTYYQDAVLWAVEKGITSGTGANTFSPDAICTRAQAVTFLYRYEKEPKVTGGNSFDDVAADAYYANAVTWASQEGITSGTGPNHFSPDTNCSRAQIVTFLFREMGTKD